MVRESLPFSKKRRLGHGERYRYPHDDPAGVVRQRYAPDAVADRVYYRPSQRGAERALAERAAALHRIVRGGPPDGRSDDDPPTPG